MMSEKDSYKLDITASTVIEFVQKMTAFYEMTQGRRPKFVILSEKSFQRLNFEASRFYALEDKAIREAKTVNGLQIVRTYDKDSEKIEFGF